VIDIPGYIKLIRGEEEWQKSDRNSITVFKANDMRVVVGGLHSGAEMIPHKAEGIMSIQVIEGSLQVKTDAFTSDLQSGNIIVIHKGFNYSVIAVEESIYLLTISNVG
jgi:quercetin dioxygenase-like cupin family protein